MSRTMLLVIASGLLWSGTVQAQLGGLKKAKDVSKTVEAFTIDDEKEMQMGAAMHAQLAAELGGLSGDQKLSEYVGTVGSALLQKSRRPGIRYSFWVINTPEVNAFAVPGGYVYITTGMLSISQDEAELAFALGHEIAHVELKHGVETLRKAAMAEVGADALSDSQSEMPPELAQVLTNFAKELALRGYGRDQELEADKLGVELANNAGYDPQGALRTLGRLLEISGSGKGGLSKFLASHPPTDQRIKLAEAQIPQLGNRGSETHADRYLDMTRP